MIKAPWSEEIVDRLNERQSCGLVHPYTCGECGSDLVATGHGWKCSETGCSYVQDWAHEPPTPEQLQQVKEFVEDLKLQNGFKI